MENIAIFGVGAMGYGVASRLIFADYPVRVTVHHSRENIDRLVEQGAIEMQSALSAAEESDIVLLCLPASTDVVRLIDEIEPVLEQRHMVIDLGTSSVVDTKSLFDRLTSKGVSFAEAPLAGGQTQALAGELGTFVGASDETFERAEPILKQFCTAIERFGDVGSGGLAKLTSNYLVLSMLRSIIETFHAAQALDIDWRKFYDTICRGSGNSVSLQRMVGSILENDSYRGYVFSVHNARKDLQYIAEMSESHGLNQILSNAALRLFTEADEKGYGDRMVSELLHSEILQSIEQFKD